MAELITTPEEDASTNFMQWDDASLGRAVKAGTFHLLDNASSGNRMAATSATMVLISLAHASNAAELKIKVEDVTHKGNPDGDWELVLTRKKRVRDTREITTAK